jgi:hypothetical protein
MTRAADSFTFNGGYLRAGEHQPSKDRKEVRNRFRAPISIDNRLPEVSLSD